jgi:light-regulated signal transduction histidine kinase (bacteriophytochrome)
LRRTAEIQRENALRKKAEEALKSYADRLARSNQELQDFATIASHDLQEPLRKILAFSDRLKVKFDPILDEEGKSYLHRVQDAASRMRTMLNDLLAYSRVTTKAQPRQPIDLNQVISEVLSDLEVRIEETRGRVDRRLFCYPGRSASDAPSISKPD